MSDLSITLFHYKLNPEKPGYSSFDRVTTLQELFSGFDDVLATIPCDNGEFSVKQAYEWLHADSDLKLDMPVTDARPGEATLNVSFRHGSSEGYLIDLILFDYRTMSYTVLVTGKWLSFEDELWSAMKALSQAIYEGMF